MGRKLKLKYKILLFVIFVCSLSYGQIKISSLPEASAVDTADMFIATTKNDLTTRRYTWGLLYRFAADSFFNIRGNEVITGNINFNGTVNINTGLHINTIARFHQDAIFDFRVTANDFVGDSSALTGLTIPQIAGLQDSLSRHTDSLLTHNTRITNNKSSIDNHKANTSNPHNVLASQLTDYNTVWDARLATKTTSNLAEGSNLYYTDTRARNSISETVTGLDYSPTTGVLSLSSGYVIPTTTSKTNWDDAYNKRVNTWTAPLVFSGNTVSLTQQGDILGTSNQISVSGGADALPGTNDVTLTLPQDIATTSNVTFNDITASGNVGSSNYASQTTGWRVDSSGSADFRKIFSSSLQVKNFISELEQAIASSEIVSKSVAVIYSDLMVSNNALWNNITNTYDNLAIGWEYVGTKQMIVKSFDGYPNLAVFADNDVIRLRDITRTSSGLNVTDSWITVLLDTSYGVGGFDAATNTQAYSITKVSGSDIFARAGSLALDYGTTGNGILELNAYDAAGSPYLDVRNWATAPYTDEVTKVRVGNLNGITDAVNFPSGVSGYGLYGTNVYLQGNLVMSGGSISWSNVNKPTKTDLGNWTTFIDSSGIYTGTLTANQITTGTLTGVTIQTATSGNNRIELNGTTFSVKNNADKTMYELFSNADTLTSKLTNSKFNGGTLVRVVDGSTNTNFLEISKTFYDINSLVQSQKLLNYELHLTDPANNGIIYFGSSTDGTNITDGDVNLYRQSANILRTDDNFIAGGYIKAPNQIYQVYNDTLTYQTTSTSYVQVFSKAFRFRSGNTKLRFTAGLSTSAPETDQADAQATVNGSSVTLTGTTSAVSYQSGTIDISGLTDGTVYVITVKLKSSNTTNTAKIVNPILEIESY